MGIMDLVVMNRMSTLPLCRRRTVQDNEREKQRRWQFKPVPKGWYRAIHWQKDYIRLISYFISRISTSVSLQQGAINRLLSLQSVVATAGD